MQRLSQSLEFDFHKKDSISIRLPVINFLESKSLLSWLAARKIMLDMGFRFELRVQAFISFYIIADAIMLLLLFALGSGFTSGDFMSTKAWIILAVHASILTTLLLIVMLPSSYINKQTQFQMKRLIFLKEVYQWIVRDKNILQQNPKRLDTKI